jgi:type II secretory pathway component PulM
MIQITSRDRKVLFAGGTFIFSWLIFIFVAQPTYQESKKLNKKIQDKILFIQKCYEILNQKSYYKTISTENKLLRTTLDQRFSSQTKPALAASEQQNLIEKLSNQTGVNIIRFRVDKPKYVENLLTISTKVTTRSKLRNLTNFIHMLESNQKFMVIEEITVQRINKTDLEELQAQLTVSGFIKTMETESKKTT